VAYLGLDLGSTGIDPGAGSCGGVRHRGLTGGEIQEGLLPACAIWPWKIKNDVCGNNSQIT
jgi:hypothetical protein